MSVRTIAEQSSDGTPNVVRSSLALVPDSIGEVFEWADFPVLCTGSWEPTCTKPATWLVRAENHDCSHDGRFAPKCDDCLESYITKGYGKCARGARSRRPIRVYIVEVREFQR